MISQAKSMTRIYFAAALTLYTIVFVTMRRPVQGLTNDIYVSLPYEVKLSIYGLALLTFIYMVIFYIGLISLCLAVYRNKVLTRKSTMRLIYLSLFGLGYSFLVELFMNYSSLL